MLCFQCSNLSSSFPFLRRLEIKRQVPCPRPALSKMPGIALRSSKRLDLAHSVSKTALTLAGVIYHATDNMRHSEVALKMEKPDKAKKILVGEYEFLKKLQGKKGIVPAHEFVQQSQPDKQSFIVMELKGANLANFKKSLGRNF
jgi:hypothetical protein